MNKEKARQSNQPASVNFAPLRATFGSGSPPAGQRAREPLNEAGKGLLEQVAGKLSLRHTARDFPHVVNRLAPFGYRPAQMVRGIDELLIDDRPTRHGFPFPVVTELSDLRAFYARLLAY